MTTFLRRLAALIVPVLALVGLAVAGAPAALAGAGSDDLQQNEQLDPGEQLWTSNGISLTMQSDGNLVERAPGDQPVWASGTNRAGSIVRMQSDGNLVIIAPGNVAVWSTGTGGDNGAGLELQSDGNLVVYAQGHVARWANGVRISVTGAASGGPAGDAFRLVNEERARRGCGPLRIDDRLQRAAQGFAADMAARDYWPDARHLANPPHPLTFTDRLGAVGFTAYQRAGENLGRGAAGSASQIVRAWVASPGHLSNIAECRFGVTGVGYDARNGARWVQMFAG